MGDFGYVVLVIFIIIRILIAAGLFYLIVVEIRRYRGRHKTQERDAGHEDPEKETKEGADGKDVDSSSGGRD